MKISKTSRQGRFLLPDWKSREDVLCISSVTRIKEDKQNDLSPFVILSAKECVDCIKDCILCCCSILLPIVISSDL